MLSHNHVHEGNKRLYSSVGTNTGKHSTTLQYYARLFTVPPVLKGAVKTRKM